MIGGAEGGAAGSGKEPGTDGVINDDVLAWVVKKVSSDVKAWVMPFIATVGGSGCHPVSEKLGEMKSEPVVMVSGSSHWEERRELKSMTVTLDVR